MGVMKNYPVGGAVYCQPYIHTLMFVSFLQLKQFLYEIHQTIHDHQDGKHDKQRGRVVCLVVCWINEVNLGRLCW